ncbi:MAG TPA: hypothetical protein IAD01_00875 [Candidatus Faeciplasma gallinarum]|uniref:Uncharacterized protein n=1 Tax=Candidatus Faeciplasma gallinarum TaxID=2840799 RepID=A0A9D1EMN2_9FIRM|nr:hypothetical protein [Candidatus Faeciplasma gallinarum]
MAISKVVYGAQTLIDLTADTITADKILTGYTAHGKDGEQISGTCAFDVNSQDATAQVAELLTGKTAYARGAKLTGTMPNNGGVTGTISTVAGQYTIAQGYHDGSGKVSIDSTEQAKLIPSNIKQGVQILGVTGTLEPSSEVTAQAKSATPTTSQQTVLPDEGYDYLTQVTIAAIPYSESPNSAGGITVTIG